MELTTIYYLDTLTSEVSYDKQGKYVTSSTLNAQRSWWEKNLNFNLKRLVNWPRDDSTIDFNLKFKLEHHLKFWIAWGLGKKLVVFYRNLFYRWSDERDVKFGVLYKILHWHKVSIQLEGVKFGSLLSKKYIYKVLLVHSQSDFG